MIDKDELEEHRAVQAVAKAVLAELGPTIGPADTEATIAARAMEMLVALGIMETWYYACPALVLLGSRSCLSVSGREYRPSDEKVGPMNLVTVDLSPLRGAVWGDCARSFCIEDGRYAPHPSHPVFVQGLSLVEELHRSMQAFAHPERRCEDLHRFANVQIEHHGFENLDFLGNVGHSIETRREDRQYIQQGNRMLLGQVRLFTFEPHIRPLGSTWGFKHENIYYFSNEGRPVEL